jgi:hypothetical protein
MENQAGSGSITQMIWIWRIETEILVICTEENLVEFHRKALAGEKG